MNFLATVLALQVQELHHQFVGVAVMDLSLKENDPVLKQQIAQRQLALALIIAVVGQRFGQQRAVENAHCVRPRGWSTEWMSARW